MTAPLEIVLTCGQDVMRDIEIGFWFLRSAWERGSDAPRHYYPDAERPLNVPTQSVGTSISLTAFEMTSRRCLFDERSEEKYHVFSAGYRPGKIG